MTDTPSIRTIHDGNAIRIVIGNIIITESDVITIVTMEQNISMHGKNWNFKNGFFYGLKVPNKNSDESDSDNDEPCSFAVSKNDIKAIFNINNIQIYSNN